MALANDFHKVLLVGHRGCAVGNIPGNTLAAYEAALGMGADVIELDVSRSMDGTLFCAHPGMEWLFMKSSKKIDQMHDNEIREMRLCNCEGQFTHYAVPELDDVLEALKGRCVIDFDKFDRYPADVLKTIVRHGMQDQALIVSGAKAEQVEAMETYAPDVAYMAVAREKDTVTQILLRRNLNYRGCVALFSETSSEFNTPEYHEKMHRIGLHTWANAINYDHCEAWSGKHDDETSMLGHPEDGWGYLKMLGYSMIQTDCLFQCRYYLDHMRFQ